MSLFHIPRPVAGDVVEVIIDDHRMIETLLRELRDASADRAAARETLADLLIAHGESEEQVVYPTLRKKHAISGDEAHHGYVEHAAGNEALLALLPVIPQSDAATLRIFLQVRSPLPPVLF